MKATLEFDLPDDKYDYDVVTQAGKVWRCLEEFKAFLRIKTKYAEDDGKTTWEEVRESFYEHFEEINWE